MPSRVVLPADHPMASAIGEFLTDLTNANRSAHTVRGYRLAQFAQHHQGAVTVIDTATLRGFFTAIADQAPATRARKRVTLSEFLMWCRRTGLLDSDPMSTIERITFPTACPAGLNRTGCSASWTGSRKRICAIGCCSG